MSFLRITSTVFLVTMLPLFVFAYSPDLSPGIGLGSLKDSTEGVSGIIDNIFKKTEVKNRSFLESASQLEALKNQSKERLIMVAEESRGLSTNISYSIRSFFDRIRLGLSLVFAGFRDVVFSVYPKVGSEKEAQSPASVSEGVIVFPSKGGMIDSQTLARLKGTFSDEVIVVPDESGETGVIQPVFRERNNPSGKSYLGDEYVYLLVPISPDE